MNEKIKKIKNFIFIIVFAVVFNFFVSDGLLRVVQRILLRPLNQIFIGYWGDTFFLRIIVSIISTVTGGIVIGTFLKKYAKIAAIVAALLTSILLALSFHSVESPEYGQIIFGNITIYISPIILIISSTISGYYGLFIGNRFIDEFNRPKSILNIKWYHWFWIFPFYLNKIVAIPLYLLLILWQSDFGSSQILSPILDLIFNFSNSITRIIIFAILIGSFMSIAHAISLLTNEFEEIKNWKKGLMIFGHVLLLLILFNVFFQWGYLLFTDVAT